MSDIGLTKKVNITLMQLCNCEVIAWRLCLPIFRWKSEYCGNLSFYCYLRNNPLNFWRPATVDSRSCWTHCYNVYVFVQVQQRKGRVRPEIVSGLGWLVREFLSFSQDPTYLRSFLYFLWFGCIGASLFIVILYFLQGLCLDCTYAFSACNF